MQAGNAALDVSAQPVAIDHCGRVQATYRGGLYVAGNTSYGKIAVAGNAIYVTGQNSVATFVRTRPGAGSTLGHGNNQVFDVAGAWPV